MYSVGQPGKFLFKMHGEEFTVDAHIHAIDGAKIEIEFLHPSNRWLQERGMESNRIHRRWLRNRQERARFLTDTSVEIKRGAPIGNKNAALAQKTIRVYVPLAPERAILFKRRLAAQIGHQPTDKEIEQAVRILLYQEIDR